MKKLLFVLGMLAAAAFASDRVILDQNFTSGLPAGWTAWSPSPSTALKLERVADGVRLSSAKDDVSSKTRIFRRIDSLKTGDWYKFEVWYRVAGNPTGVLAVAEWSNQRKLRVLRPETADNGEMHGIAMIQMPQDAGGGLNLHLFAGYTAGASVVWKAVRVTHTPDYQLPHRFANIAVIDSKPAEQGPVLANARHYVAEIDRACAKQPKPDLILLPENFNRSNSTAPFAVSIDSDYMKVLGDAARRNRVYLAGSIQESRGANLYNSAVLIDRQGRVIGQYDKSHLTIGEMLFGGLVRGNEVKVFQTDFGKVGLLVCWDFHFPEISRLLALKGAELVLVPMASDGRLKDDGLHRGAEHSGKAFVIENRVPVVFAATLGSSVQPSLIIDQHGKVLARTTDDRHTIQARLDLEEKNYQWSSDDFQTVYSVSRRPEMYAPLGQ